MVSSTASTGLGAWLDAKTLIGFAIAIGLGALLAAYPVPGLGAVALCLTLYGILRLCRGHLEFWQALVLLAITPYVILNYGFDNLAVGAGGFHFPVGELLMFLALALVVLKSQSWNLRNILAEPPVLCLIALLLLSCAHLIFDVPRYGLYAVRDSSLFFDAPFLILGAVWARNARSMQLLMRWLFFLFVLNLFYTYTFPWREGIQAWSPTSGVFHQVPLFGNYQQSGSTLVLGALFCIWLAPSIVRLKRWILVLLAGAQLSGLALLQVRSMYVGIAVILAVLLLLRETKKLTGFATALGCGIAALLVLLSAVSLLGIKLEGRMGPVDFSFIEEHAETVLAVGDANARMSHDVDRSEWYGQVWDRVRSSPSNLMVGEGFGQALINFENEEGIPVRQPHNASLTVLARLGFLGLSVWVLFIVLVLARYIRALRMKFASEGSFTLILWLFFFTLLGLMQASVQPSFEFSHGAIPFYFLLGLAFGIMRIERENLGPRAEKA